MNKFFGLIVLACFVAGSIAQPAGSNIDCNNAPNSDPDQCCKTPTFFKNEMVLACETAVANKNNTPSAECIANCLLSKNGVINTNGSLKKEALSEFLIKVTGDAVWNKALTNAVKICVDDGAKRADDFAKAAKAAGCPPLPLFTIDCVYMQLFKNCPNDRWSSNANCASLKAFVNKCALV